MQQDRVILVWSSSPFYSQVEGIVMLLSADKFAVCRSLLLVNSWSYLHGLRWTQHPANRPSQIHAEVKLGSNTPEQIVFKIGYQYISILTEVAVGNVVVNS